jgi:hypothetical protein
VNYRDGNFGEKALRMSAVVDYKIAAYLEEPQVDENMKSEDVYLVASHREQRSYLLDLICFIQSWRTCIQRVSCEKYCLKWPTKS